jgi:hypothetical protein
MPSLASVMVADSREARATARSRGEGEGGRGADFGARVCSSRVPWSTKDLLVQDDAAALPRTASENPR